MAQPIPIIPPLPAQLIRFDRSQMAVIGVVFTILFAVLTFIVNYVEKATASPAQSDLGLILNKQTDILSRVESKTSEVHDILNARTEVIRGMENAGQANTIALASISLVLNEQAKAVREQTLVLQKLSIWLDMQIKKGG